MKACFQLLMAMSVLIALNVNAKETDEVVVTASYIDRNLSEIENPLHLVDGDKISENLSQSLGESLDELLGVSSTDYGPAVGQPVIRGMSGNRIKVLNNGMVVRDLSGIGGDHINDVDLNDIQQIEVVRGPSSLLYSNGTIGGIINIVDNTIPKTDIEAFDLKVGAESQSVNDGDSYNLSFANNLGGVNLTFAYKDSKFGNFDIPSGAIIHTEEEHEEEGHEDEHEDEHEENPSFLANSDYGSESSRIGLSKTADWGYIGASYGSVESLYGIPFHGEEHEDEHEEGHEEEEHEEEEHEGERIFTTTDTDIFNVEGSYSFRDSFINKADFYFRDTDSSLTEQHDEEAHEDEHEDEHEDKHEDEHEDEHEGHSEGPTLFKNDAKEYGITFDLGSRSFTQKMAVKFADEKMSIMGEEALMNPTDSDELSIGYYVSAGLDLFHLDFGIRHDKVSRNGSVTHREEDHHEDEGHADEHEEAEIDYFDRDISSTSYAFSLSNDLNDFTSINLGLSYLERAPSVVELFINGPHLATGRLEVGNTNLKQEEANNIDLTLSYENNDLFASLTFFRNDIDNYIYLLDETEEEHEEHEDEHEGLILANYFQKDAQMQGYEFEIGKTFGFYQGQLMVSFGLDSVSAEFSDGLNIPRITPQRNIYKLAYSEEDLKILLSYKDVDNQDDIGVGETATAGYEMLDMRITKVFSTGKGSLNVSVFGTNLLDEVARNHSSFVKNEVPLAGRSYGAKFTYKF